MSLEYTKENWEEKMKTPSVLIQFPNGPFAFGSILPCPWCKTIGFYGPRVAPPEGEPTRKYRACKFCGWWQEVWGDVYNKRGGEQYRCIMVFHKCSKGEVYDWKVPWDKNCQHCSECGSNNLKQVEWPIDDLNHPFHKIKQVIENYIEQHKF